MSMAREPATHNQQTLAAHKVITEAAPAGAIQARTCPVCDQSNPADSQTCLICTAPLAACCPNCQQPVTHQKRATARSLSRRVGTLLMRWAVCPSCGARFVSSKGPCPECGTRLCPQCNLMLLPEEITCLRCGFESGATCPRCRASIAPDMPECTACGQPLCPDCGAAIGENDTVCAACGAELALFCSECGGEVGPSEITCPHCGTLFDLAPLDNAQDKQDRPFGAEDAPDRTESPQADELRGQCAACGRPVPLSSLVCDDCLYRPSR